MNHESTKWLYLSYFSVLVDKTQTWVVGSTFCQNLDLDHRTDKIQSLDKVLH